jgi:hypothetical protein
MDKRAILTVLLAAAGFAAGFAWGRGTRDALPGATATEYSGGVLTVSVDTTAALVEGLRRAIR